MSAFKTKCPICHHIIENETYTDAMGVVEQIEHCKNCNYFYQFSYGAYMEIVGDTQFIWSWDSFLNKNFNRFLKKRKNKMFMTRRNYIKFKRKTNPVQVCSPNEINVGIEYLV